MRVSLTRLLHVSATLLVFASAVHICVVLLMPHLSYGNAWNRLEQFIPANKLETLAVSDTGPPPMPFMAPDVLYAACRYDLTQGPVELHTPLPSELWSIALYTQIGENYYLIGGEDVQGSAVNILLVHEKTVAEEKKEDFADQNVATRDVHEVTVSAPSATGIVLIRAPMPTPSYEAQIGELLKSAYCRPVVIDQQVVAEASPDKAEPAASAAKEPARGKRKARRKRQRLDSQRVKQFFPF